MVRARARRPGASRAAALAVAAAAAAAAGCLGVTAAKPFKANNFPAAVPDDTRLATLDLPLAATVTTAFSAPAAIAPVPLFVGLSRGVANRAPELIEGSLFVADVTSTAGLGAGEVWQVLDDGAPGAAASTTPYFAVPDGAPRGLAIDQFDVKGTIGRLWIAAGRTLHVVAGPLAPGREVAAIALPATVLPSGETLRALVAGPFGINLFAASDATIVRIDVAAAPTASAITRYATLAAGPPVFGLAVTPDGTLFIGRSDGTGATLAFEAIPQALETPGAVAGTSPFQLTGAFAPIAEPRGLAVNSAGDLLIADRRDGRLLEFSASTGALVAASAAPIAAPEQVDAITADPFISRVLFATDADPAPASFAVRAIANRTLAGGVQPILTNRCVPCHEAGFDNAGLVLKSGRTLAATVSVTACESEPVPACDLLITSCPSCPQPAPLPLVAPGDPASSYLVRKIEASAPGLALQPPDACSPDVCGERMPQASFFPAALRREEIAIIRAWIAAGAPND
jgi:hypothetical protein